MWPAKLRVLIATLWVGSIWAVGYLAAPTLFATLADRVLAGTIAGSLFRVEAWLSLACGVVLLALSGTLAGDAKARLAFRAVVGGMVLCTLIGYFGLQPFMAALKDSAGPAGVMASDAKARFGMLHGVSSAIYLVQSLLGAVLVLRVR